MSWLAAFLALVPFYLLGSFPSGYLIAKARGVDITSAGSGNVGATNVARVMGKKAGVMTLLVDVLKGLLGVLVASWLSSSATFAAAVGVAVVAGHCFSVPPWLKGGKGVATSLGAILALNWLLAVSAVVVFAAVFAVSKIVSLASVAAAISVPLIGFLLVGDDTVAACFAFIALLVVFRHKENLKRLSEGREPAFKSAGT